MVHGMLQDRGAEFFIVHNTEAGATPSSSTERAEDHMQNSYEESTLEWHNGFVVSLDALPPYVPLATAETILFIGKAVRVLRHPNPTFRGKSEKSRDKSADAGDAQAGEDSWQPSTRVPSAYNHVGHSLSHSVAQSLSHSVTQSLAQSRCQKFTEVTLCHFW
jgi:hypothetical protein